MVITYRRYNVEKKYRFDHLVEGWYLFGIIPLYVRRYWT